ncbi:MAG TPA: hypothetical protein VFY65_10400, partial [Longimicrobium sp.]|nr:hypothetical protein [Longimicrobium sp.]
MTLCAIVNHPQNIFTTAGRISEPVARHERTLLTLFTLREAPSFPLPAATESGWAHEKTPLTPLT